MDLTTKYTKDLKDKIEFYEEQILIGPSYEDSEGIALEYRERLGQLRGYKDALELFEHTIKVFIK